MNRYEEIITNKLGVSFIHTVNTIKAEQCNTCVKKRKNFCRLTIKDSKCVNYKKNK